jgi:glutathione S-transferase
MVIVHHLNNSRSQRILWLLEELAVPYEVKRYERDPKTMLAPPELRAVHPLGKSPVITHGERVVAETGAIVTYLVDNFSDGQLMPAGGTEDRLRYIYWLHFAEGSAMPLQVMSLIFGEMPKQTPFLVRPVAKAISAAVQKAFLRPNIDAQLDYIEAELTGSPWFAGGSFSAADVMMSFPLEAANARGGLGTRTRTREWLSRIHDRPAYQAALERGGPYAFAAHDA